jgi:signal transduction histidine kinase
MYEHLCFVTCSNFEPEIRKVISDQGWLNVLVHALPLQCSAPVPSEKIFEPLTGILKTSPAKLVFTGCHCLNFRNFVKSTGIDAECLEFQNCFEMFINPDFVRWLTAEGAYLVTNGWFRNYQKNIEQWGFDAETARVFFRESAKKLVLLETGLPGSHLELLPDLAGFMGLPYEIIPVGPDHCRLIISHRVHQWELEMEKAKINTHLAISMRQTADYSFAFTQINMLAVLTVEQSIVEKLKEFVRLLFAPQNIEYQSFYPENHDQDTMFGSERDFLSGTSLISMPDGFFIRLEADSGVVGQLRVGQVAFPEYLSHYMSLSEVIGKVGGLAVSNARKFQVIRESEAMLKSLNASKDKFFSIIAHDLKNPFSSILGFSDLMKKDAASLAPDQVYSYSHIVNNAARHALQLLENLMTWAQMQQGSMSMVPERIKVDDLVQNEFRNLKPNAHQKDINLEMNVPDNIFIYVDVNMMSLTIRNLIANAIKFTPAMGSIVVSASKEHDQVAIAVKDTGVGMKSELIQRLFRIETSFSTKGTNLEKGTGLGLLLCKEFIDKHKGTIEVTSEPGIGSVFTIRLESAQ